MAVAAVAVPLLSILASVAFALPDDSAGSHAHARSTSLRIRSSVRVEGKHRPAGNEQRAECQGTWLACLPNFATPEDLRRDGRWLAYFQYVYNSKNPEVGLRFPLRLGADLAWVDLDALSKVGLPGPEPGTVPSIWDIGRIKDDGDAFTGLVGVSCVGCLNVYRPLQEAFQSSARVEVIHCKEPNRREPAYWMYLAPGSGVFYDLGRTISFGDHGDVCARCREHNCACDQHSEFQFLRAEGYDSVQFTDHHEQGGLQKFEIVDLRGLPDSSWTSYVCPLQATPFTNVHGQSCKCDPDSPRRLCSNCLR